VLGNAVLSGNVRVEDHAVVANSVTASDNVVISGHAIVNGGGWVYDNGWYEGSVKLSGNAQIGDSAVVYNSCTVSGNAKVLQKAYLSEGTTVKDNVVVKGMAAPTGRSTYSGTAILDGDYTNNENKQSGIGYGWLDDYGWVNAQEGLTSGYDFSNQSDVWASDNNASTSVLTKNAQWQAERTSASGVLSFDGDNDYALIDSSAVRSKNLQISFAVLPKGGKTQQEVFHFGDDKAYMSFTPKNNDGKAEFTITDGTDTQVLTSPSLPEGQWSKVTVLIMDGYAVLYVNSQPVDTQEARFDPVMVLSASENDTCYLGKGIIGEDFKGAVDYINFSYKTIGEPGTVYSGSEEAEKEPEQPTEPVTEPITEPVTELTTVPETEPVTEPVPQKIIGDVNADKQLSAADVVMLSRWLIKEGELTDPDAADADFNDMINVIDLLIIKKSVISQL
jgi:carbonic anhydrase/acetyltransferase-like protein (isoleucine patch superfamily)